MAAPSRIAAAAALLQACAWLPQRAAAQMMHPQYLLMNKAVFDAAPLSWNQYDLSTCTQASIDEILNAIGTRGTSKRRLGFAFPIMLLGSQDQQQQYLSFMDCLLNLSTANDLPIALALDSFEFWDTRPDLWNWYNASAPGYNPANVANVEWTCWDSASCATMLAWRDWGSQFRVPPHPNLASPTVLSAYLEVLRPAAAKVAAWYASLPTDKKYLLAYVKAGWEVDIGANYYVYPNGNSYYGKDPKEDPTGGVGSGAVVQQGYAAICTSGLACSGNVTVAQLDRVVNTFLSTLSQAIVDAGVPRMKVMTHQGASFNIIPTNHSVWSSAEAAVTPYAGPGWSFYTFAYDPSQAPTLAATVAALEGAPWACSEWLYMGGNSGTPQQQWAAAFSNSLGLMNSRMIALYNFESIRGKPDPLAAAAAFLSAPVPCLVDAVGNFTWSPLSDDQIQVSWVALGGADDDASARYFDVSTLPLLKPSGALAVPTVVNHANVTGQSYFVFTPPGPGEYYVSVVSTGCSGEGFQQSMPSEVFLIEV